MVEDGYTELVPFPTLIRQSAERVPKSTAVIYKNITLTYEELVRLAVRISSVLPDSGTHVAICCEKGIEWILACLACSFAGVPFTMIDKRSTLIQRKHICETWKPKLLLHDDHFKEENIPDDCHIERHSVVELMKIKSNSTMDKRYVPNSNTAVFVDWTTGTSTGKPKGVIMVHEQLSNMLRWRETEFPMDDNDIIAVNMFPLWYWWMALCCGQRTLIIPDDVVIDSTMLVEYLAEHKATRIDCFTPSLLRAVSQNKYLSSIKDTMKMLVMSGEGLPLDTVQMLHEILPNTLIVNLLSTTEAGDVAAFCLTPFITEKLISTGMKFSPVGNPITPRVTMNILNDELLVSGSGVPNNACYLGSVDNSFRDHNGRRTWFTSDHVEMLRIETESGPKNVFVLKGRLNQTAKVRGFKINIASIQNSLRQIPSNIINHSQVVDAAVLVSSDSDSLIGCFRVFDEVAEPTAVQPAVARELSLFLKQTSPEWHIPSAYFIMSSFPVTPTGKLDTRQLRSIIEGIAAPFDHRNQIPHQADAVLSAWIELLGEAAIDCGDDVTIFDIGGHSLIITKLAAAIGVRVADIMDNLTIRSQRELLASKSVNKEQSQQDDLPLNTKLDRDIAIIGLAVRWPDNTLSGNNIKTVFDSLKKGTDLTVPIKKKPKRGILLAAEFITHFDCNAWGVSKEEILLTDPNQRIVCEVGYEALVDAGYAYRLPSKSMRNSKSQTYTRQNPTRNVGVFSAGASLPQYLTDIMTDKGGDTLNMRFDNPALYWELEVGNDKDYTATRISYLLDLRGPSQTIQTACSSALTAIHTAVSSLRDNQCDVALVTAASIQVPQDAGYNYQPGMVWSVTGQCHPYDKTGSGTVPGNAAVAFILKPKNKSIEDGDRIYSVIKGIGISNDGRQKHSYNSPSRLGQVTAIKKAQRDTDTETVRNVSMIEGHGTGTAVGDPIELAAIQDSYPTNNISLSSVKGHVGHVNTAAGGIGLLKATLSLYHKTLLPTANFSSPVAELQNISIKKQSEHWEVPSTSIRSCGVSSFGVGGTNVHLICSEYIPESITSDDRSEIDMSDKATILLSSHSKEALKASCEQYRSLYFSDKLDTDVRFADLEYTLSTRPTYPFRAVVTSKNSFFFTEKTSSKTLVLCFPGQGGCYRNLGIQLRREIPAFDELFKSCEAALGRSISHTPDTNRDEQLLIFSVEYCLAILLKESININPTHLIGHSLGEIVCATIVGVFSLQTALRFVEKRGQISDSIAEGTSLGMLSVAGSDISEVEVLVSEYNSGNDQKVEIACINSPLRSVIAGPSSALDSLTETFTKNNKPWTSKRLAVKTAFHTSAMLEGVNSLREFFSENEFSVPVHSCELLSSVTGTVLSVDKMCSVEYWVNHLTQKVLFSKAAGLIPENATVIECGPSLLKGCISESCKSTTTSVLPRPSENSSKFESTEFWSSIGQLWASGCVFDYEKVLQYKYQSGNFHITDLPPPSWDRQLCWPETPTKKIDNNHVLSQETNLYQQPDVVEYEYKINNMLTDIVNTNIQQYQCITPLYYIKQTADRDFPLGAVCCDDTNVLDFVKKYRTLVISGSLHSTEMTTAAETTSLLGTFITLVQKIGAMSTAQDIPVTVFVVVPASDPHYAPLVAFSRVVQKEFNSVRMSRILIQNNQPNILSTIINKLKLLNHSSDEYMFDAANNKWYTPTLTAVPQLNQSLPVDSSQVVAITGGTMGLGLEIAKWFFTNRMASKIYLMGRTILSQESKQEICKKISGQSEQDGIEFLTGDVSRKEDIIKLYSTVSSCNSKVSVYHCAGVVSDQIIKNIPQDNNKLTSQVAAKIHGVQNLLSVFGSDEQVNLFLCSSSSSIFAPAGQGVYAAANGYIDTYSKQHVNTTKTSALVISIQWGGWEVGMSERFNIKPEEGEMFLNRTQDLDFVMKLLPNIIGKYSTICVTKIIDWVKYGRALSLPSSILSPQHSDLMKLPGTDDPYAWQHCGLTYLRSHTFNGSMIVPATFWLHVMLCDVISDFKNRGRVPDIITLRNINFIKALDIPSYEMMMNNKENDAQISLICEIDTSITPPTISIHSSVKNNKKLHCTAELYTSSNVKKSVNDDRLGALKQIESNFTASNLISKMSHEELYRLLANEGFHYTSEFKAVDHVIVNSNTELLASIVDYVDSNGPISAAALDCCTQLSSVLQCSGIPIGIQEMVVHTPEYLIDNNNSVNRYITLAKKTPFAFNGTTKVDFSIKKEGRSHEVITMRGFECAPTTDNQARKYQINKQQLSTVEELSRDEQMISDRKNFVFSSTDSLIEFAPSNCIKISSSTISDIHKYWTASSKLYVLIDVKNDFSPSDHLNRFIDDVIFIHCEIVVDLSKLIQNIINEKYQHSTWYYITSLGVKTFIEKPISKSQEMTTPIENPVGEFKIKVSQIPSGGYSSTPKTISTLNKCTDDEIKIKVDYWSLNFLDILLASGVLGMKRLGDVGGECVGIVTESKSDKFKIGDKVAGLARDGIGSHAIVPSHCAMLIGDLPQLQASTISLAYGTAWLGLCWLAPVQENDFVLIHSAAGGVGLACVHLVLRRGGIPICTTSTETKKNYLISIGVKEQHIFNSRDYHHFVTGVASVCPEGVSTVVNSLAGTAMKESIGLLKPFGKFLELGKRDQESHTNVDLSLFSMGQQYCSCHLDVLLQNKSLGSKLLSEIWEAASDLPELNTNVFPISELPQAMQLLSSGKHIGKVIVSCPSGDHEVQQHTTDSCVLLKNDDNIASDLTNKIIQNVGDVSNEYCISEAPLDFSTTVVMVVTNVKAVQDAVDYLQRSLKNENISVNGIRIFCCCQNEKSDDLTLMIAMKKLLLIVETIRDSGRTINFIDGIQTEFYNNDDLTSRLITDNSNASITVSDTTEESKSTNKTNTKTTEEALLLLKEHAAVRRGLSPSEITDKSSLIFLGFDSLAQLQFAHTIRTVFGVKQVPPLSDETTLLDLAILLSSNVEKKKFSSNDVTVYNSNSNRSDIPTSRNRILCLHGYRSNSHLMIQRLQKYVSSESRLFGSDTSLILVNAPCKARGNGDANIPVTEELFEWFYTPSDITNETGWNGLSGIRDSKNLIDDIFNKYEPFEAVVGFSQGGAMALSVLETYKSVPKAILFSPVVIPQSSLVKDEDQDVILIYDPSESLSNVITNIESSLQPSAVLHHNDGHVIPVGRKFLETLKPFTLG